MSRLRHTSGSKLLRYCRRDNNQVRFGETIAKQIKCRAVDDPQERVKMLATIAEMDSMVGAALQFARDEATTEHSVQPTLPRLSRASTMTWRTPACR